MYNGLVKTLISFVFLVVFNLEMATNTNVKYLLDKFCRKAYQDLHEVII